MTFPHTPLSMALNMCLDDMQDLPPLCPTVSFVHEDHFTLLLRCLPRRTLTRSPHLLEKEWCQGPMVSAAFLLCPPV